ncbi:hypothetical protein RhiXN_06360 [Rhizoctonia solani]|uniref:Uncharacterized protein n=1 Tax=Rhizoctonia solani TaxID=456999 RepID=A0A8H8SWU0_9AGAM|nr:uncharacterized protein RhiXN_06360 [Rhizoctonia solani]QRW21371.1 hypothetical protein RhiXN_06360 [Rhizoctonia solani]
MEFSSSPSPMGSGKRAPPPPIRIAQSSYTPPNYVSSRRGSASTLLYDMPSASPRKMEYGSANNRLSQSRILTSPPATEQLLYSIPAPGSPPVRISGPQFAIAHESRRSVYPQSPPLPLLAREHRHHSSQNPRRRSLMNTKLFVDNCEIFPPFISIFCQDENAKIAMDAMMNKIPQYHQAKYTRVQANVRREFHLTQSLRKISEFRAHLSSVQPGCSLSPAARATPSGTLARRERADKFQAFLDAQCGSAGTQNFFIGLYAAMKLQTLPPSIGGTGESRIEWEIDDAVFMESGGNQFMLDAIDMMKGVLGFDERPLNYRPLPCRSFHQSSLFSSTNVLPRDRAEDPSVSEAINKPVRAAPPGRSRASSDPFLDPTRSSLSMNAALSMALPTPEESATDLDSLGPSTPLDERGPEIPPPASLSDQYAASTYSMDAETFLNEQQLRIWTFPPYITNPELHKLMAMFPSSITSQTVPRFRPLAKTKQRKGRRKGADVDLEGDCNLQMGLGIDPAGFDNDLVKERGEIRKGTGRMWIGDLMRLPGWRGTFWDTIRDWFRHLFR